MTVHDQHAVDRPAVRAVPSRWPVTAVFFINGLTLSTYIVRAPSLKSAYHLTDGRFGFTGMLFAVAALACMQLAGPMVARLGSRAVLRVTLVVMPLLLAGTAVAPGRWGFAVAAAALGAVHGTTDVAMNAGAVSVERLIGRPILNGCHAAWSVSAVVASVVTAALAAAGVALSAHLAVAAAVLLAAGLLVTPRLPAADGDRDDATAHLAHQESPAGPGWRHGWSRALLVLGLTGTALMVCEGAALGWGGIFLHDGRGASLSVAATAVTAYTAGQTGGRLVGDRLSGRLGPGLLFRIGASVAAGGFAVAVLAPPPMVAVGGFALAGVGASVLLPLTFSAVGRLPGAATATLVSRLTTFTYAGLLFGPALIGWAAELFGLTATLFAAVPVLAVLAVLPRPGAPADPVPHG
ncbi:MFS transporter [Dactylosporangium sp. NPDC048998]|uniref:MFS transporter n=1 Tax=Dactylosporangium sp. NPDC048998 TaxID=3363976 RepID=UPI003715D856